MVHSLNINISIPLSHHSFYGACLEFICATGDRCPYRFNIPMPLALAYAIVSIVNSTMSVIVFSLDKYNHRITSRLLKFCSYFHLMAVLFLFAKFVVHYALGDASDLSRSGQVDFLQRGLAFSYLAALNMSQGSIAYLCILRYVNTRYPLFIGFSPHAHTLSYIVLLFIFVVSCGIHSRAFFSKNGVVGLMDADDLYLNVAYNFIIIAIVIGFNIAWVFREHMRRRNISSKHHSSTTSIPHKMFRYAALSSLLFMFTTLPATVYFVAPKPDYVVLSCKTCLDRAEIGDYLTVLMFSLCFFDNLLYFVQSKQYRQDLMNRAKKVMFLAGMDKRLLRQVDSKRDFDGLKMSVSRVTLVGAYNTNREARCLAPNDQDTSIDDQESAISGSVSDRGNRPASPLEDNGNGVGMEKVREEDEVD